MLVSGGIEGFELCARSNPLSGVNMGKADPYIFWAAYIACIEQCTLVAFRAVYYRIYHACADSTAKLEGKVKFGGKSSRR